MYTNIIHDPWGLEKYNFTMMMYGVIFYSCHTGTKHQLITGKLLKSGGEQCNKQTRRNKKNTGKERYTEATNNQ